MVDRCPSHDLFSLRYRRHLAGEVLLGYLVADFTANPDARTVPLLQLASHPRDRDAIDGAALLQREGLVFVEPFLSNRIAPVHRIGLTARGHELAAANVAWLDSVHGGTRLDTRGEYLLSRLTMYAGTYRVELGDVALRAVQVLEAFSLRTAWVRDGAMMGTVIEHVSKDLGEAGDWTHARASRKALLFLDLEAIVSFLPLRDEADGWVQLTSEGRQLLRKAPEDGIPVVPPRVSPGFADAVLEKVAAARGEV